MTIATTNLYGRIIAILINEVKELNRLIAALGDNMMALQSWMPGGIGDFLPLAHGESFLSAYFLTDLFDSAFLVSEAI